MDTKMVKIIGAISSIAGVAATLVGNWAAEKKNDEKIEKKVAEEVARQLQK